jgi:hypothetical protein
MRSAAQYAGRMAGDDYGNKRAKLKLCSTYEGAAQWAVVAQSFSFAGRERQPQSWRKALALRAERRNEAQS